MSNSRPNWAVACDSPGGSYFAGSVFPRGMPRRRHETAPTILAKSGCGRGLVVHLGCGDGKLTAALRAPCSYGFLPANGLLYMPPSPCFCYPGVKLSDFNALAANVLPVPGSDGGWSRRASAIDAARPMDPKSLTPNAEPQTLIAKPRTLPTGPRTGTTRRAGPPRCLSRPTCAVVAEPPGRDAHAAGRGRRPIAGSPSRCPCDPLPRCGRWQAFVELYRRARIDSPPTVHQGAVLFGCCDGWVYSLRAADGCVGLAVSRSPCRAADRLREPARIGLAVPRQRPGARWPRLLHRRTLVVPRWRHRALRSGREDRPGSATRPSSKVRGPTFFKEVGRPFDMEGAKSDVLVADSRHICLYQLVFHRALKRVEAPRLSTLGDRKMGIVSRMWDKKLGSVG